MPINTNFKVIAIDADDTLWMNEPYFRGMESDYCRLLQLINENYRLQPPDF